MSETTEQSPRGINMAEKHLQPLADLMAEGFPPKSLGRAGDETNAAKYSTGSWEDSGLSIYVDGSKLAQFCSETTPEVWEAVKPDRVCITDEEARANVILCLAAPDMLKALVHVLGCIENGDGEFESVVRAAIAKARGT